MKKLLIVGGGHATAALLNQLHKQTSNGCFDWQVTVISAESTEAVNRPLLSKDYLSHKVGDDQLPLIASEVRQAMTSTLGLQWLTDCRVISVDRQRHQLQLYNGCKLEWDTLVLATGVRLRQLSLPGGDQPVSEMKGVFYLKTASQSQALRQALQHARQLTVIGGGFIGLEVAATARQQGVAVRVLESGERLLRRVVAAPVSHWFQQMHIEQGVELRLNSSLQHLLADDHGNVRAIQLASGDVLATDLVVVGVGVEPETGLAQSAGLACDNGILVNEQCQTSDPNIFAAGDGANRRHPLYQQRLRLESVENATHQGQLIAAMLTQSPLPPTAVPWFWSTQYDARLQIAGLSQGYDQLITRQAKGKPGISWLYLRQGRLLACDAVNRPADFLQAKKLIGSGQLLDPLQAADAAIPLGQCVAPVDPDDPNAGNSRTLATAAVAS
ncbi:NAD(P)/FAD-dependent oxidoreductase [Oceanobacter antarcticus]|uniref:FAD-dependent oxidoreductase n=1 Tax=Oceanobacter antarcticus TaxID=3133425 RepID=A0ABW8NP97_9GAMM|tara:strand:+ start:469 stop:1794 length:1326 start_codon:yes stop_codon:yes gene_type:complete